MRELVFSGCKTVGNRDQSDPLRACILGKGYYSGIQQKLPVSEKLEVDR